MLARFPGPSDWQPALRPGPFRYGLAAGDARTDAVSRRRRPGFRPGHLRHEGRLDDHLAGPRNISLPRTAVLRPIWVLFTSDEEIGSPTSRGLIETLARQCAYVLVLEPPLADGASRPRGRGSAGSSSRSRARPPMPASRPRTVAARSSSWPTRSLRIQDLQDLAAGRRSMSASSRAARPPTSCRRRRRPRSTCAWPRLAEAERIDASISVAESGHDGCPTHGERTIQPAADGAIARRSPRCSSRPGAIGRDARPGAHRGLDRRRQRRQLHRGAGSPDPRRPGRARRRRPRRRRAILIDSLPERAALLAALLLELQVES